MRAVVVSKMGEAEVLKIRDIPEPQPEAGQVTIDVEFAAVGLVDVLARRGTFNTPLPFVPAILSMRTVLSEVIHLKLHEWLKAAFCGSEVWTPKLLKSLFLVQMFQNENCCFCAWF